MLNFCNCTSIKWWKVSWTELVLRFKKTWIETWALTTNRNYYIWIKMFKRLIWVIPLIEKLLSYGLRKHVDLLTLWNTRFKFSATFQRYHPSITKKLIRTIPVDHHLPRFPSRWRYNFKIHRFKMLFYKKSINPQWLLNDLGNAFLCTNDKI